MREIKEICHDLVGELVAAVGKQEDFGTALADARQEHGQALVLLHVLVHVLDGARLQVAVDVHIVHGIAHVLENGLEGHGQVATAHSSLLPRMAMVQLIPLCLRNYKVSRSYSNCAPITGTKQLQKYIVHNKIR